MKVEGNKSFTSVILIVSMEFTGIASSNDKLYGMLI